MKREPLGNEQEQDSWIGATFRRMPQTASDACPDTETLAAWADGGLGAAAASAVELHSSNCSRCMAVLAATARSAPPVTTRPAWSPALVIRWVAPLAAAAAAVAIWIAVPDRPVTVAPSSSGRESSVQLAPENQEPRALNSEPGTLSRDTAPGTQNAEPQAQLEQPGQQGVESSSGARADRPDEEQRYALQDAQRRERAVPEALGSTAAEKPSASPRAAAQVAAPPPAVSTDTLAGTMTMSKRTAADSPATDSIAPANPLVHWRVVGAASIERSIDGGKSWTMTRPAAPSMARIRAVDADRAVVTTPDGVDFFTVDAGRSWTRVQEKTAAPF